MAAMAITAVISVGRAATITAGDITTAADEPLRGEAPA
jgi:hypothetical protein